jgi:hypothetical protein
MWSRTSRKQPAQQNRPPLSQKTRPPQFSIFASLEVHLTQAVDALFVGYIPPQGADTNEDQAEVGAKGPFAAEEEVGRAQDEIPENLEADCGGLSCPLSATPSVIFGSSRPSLYFD